LNLHLGVVGDHRKRPARLTIPEPDTGRQLLIDEKLDVEGRGVGLRTEHTDESGRTVRRYDFMSEAEEHRTLDELRAKGFMVEMLERTVTPLLRTKPLSSGLQFGGGEGMRATARIALNFLAIQEPEVAHAAQLELFKRWILSGDRAANEFVNFGGELPPAFRIANQYEVGHRIIVGLDPDDGVFARISFFDTYELAVRLGPGVSGPRRYYVWDLDPTARHQQPGVDRIERALNGALAYSPGVLGEFAASSAEVYDRVQTGSDRILDAARARIDQEHAERLTRHLSLLSSVPRDRLPERVTRLLQSELQCAANLVSRVAPLVEQQIGDAGYSWTAHYLHALIDSELPEFIVPLSESVLNELGSVMVGLVEREKANAEQVHSLLFGMTGLSIANKALVGRLGGMRIWYKGDGPQLFTTPFASTLHLQWQPTKVSPHSTRRLSEQT